MDNRFIAILLIAEGLTSYMIPHCFQLITLIGGGCLNAIMFRGIFKLRIISILMYLCFPIYFRVNMLRFAGPTLQKHAWYIPLVLTTVYMVFRYCRTIAHVLRISHSLNECDWSGTNHRCCCWKPNWNHGRHVGAKVKCEGVYSFSSERR